MQSAPHVDYDHQAIAEAEAAWLNGHLQAPAPAQVQPETPDPEPYEPIMIGRAHAAPPPIPVIFDADEEDPEALHGDALRLLVACVQREGIGGALDGGFTIAKCVQVARELRTKTRAT